MEKLELCVRQISNSEGVPPFCDHATEILTRTLDLDGGSCKKLVQVVLQDMGLTAHVLRLEVRGLASALRYIEHFANRSPRLRELVLASVLTAVQSREVAGAAGYPHPEEAYICGLFRNLGEVLIACNYPEEHSRIILILDEENIPERAACLRVLDFSWDEVGTRVAERWQMPPAVRFAMDKTRAGRSPLEASLASVTNYAHRLTHVLYRKGATIDTIHLETVLRPTGQSVLVSVRDLRAIIEFAAAETRDMFAALRIPTETLRISNQAERARKALESNSVV